MGRFLPSGIGADHCRLRDVGWEKCGHGIPSRLTETSFIHFLNELLLLFRYPVNSGVDLFDGVLPLRYCTTSCARVPPWALPSDGHVADLSSEGGEDVAPSAGVGSVADGVAGGAGGL